MQHTVINQLYVWCNTLWRCSLLSDEAQDTDAAVTNVGWQVKVGGFT